MFGGCDFQQTFGIPLGTNYPLSKVLNTFLNCSEHKFCGSSVCSVIMVTNSENSIAPLPEKLSEKKVKKIIKEVDLDGDGCINYQGKYL
jgi:hypothetical protein